ncbi:GNAT family N-acetyltransferase [Alteromonas sp. RW2A1]|uniref:GNAT family N-acetyltransferase n=1 Tax=Alteromonas sp. RW2A1 TaxID=1917158 RepID=UPI000903BACB|nr:GNAT family protein [Alteromonas sp. RW2A1]APE04817.1 GNAT family N-acetyltransferase [Alteromonas sp. RW2A1]
MVSLRDFTENDVDSIVTILNNDSVTQFLSTKIPTPYTLEDAKWWVSEGSKGDLIKAISVNGQLAGCIGVTRGDFEYQKSGEIGYWIAQKFWRKGVASSALDQMSEYVFSNTDIVRLFASVFSSNAASMGLLLKYGFTQEAILQKAIFKNGQFYDNHIFAKLRSF